MTARRFDQFSPTDLIAATIGILGGAVILLRWLAIHGDNALAIIED